MNLPLWVWVTLLAIAVGGVASYPTYQLGGREALESMLVGGGLAWLAVVASALGLSLVFRNSPELQWIIVLGGFVVRLALLFVLLAWTARTLMVNLSQVVLWLVGYYLVLVVFEAYFLVAGTSRGRTQR